MRVVKQQAGKCTAHEIADDRNGCIPPVGTAFAGNWKQGMRETRTEIAGWINGVAGGSTEREADAPDEAGYEPRSDSRGWAGRRNSVREDGACHDNQHHCADDFAGNVSERAADGRTGTEDAEFGAGSVEGLQCGAKWRAMSAEPDIAPSNCADQKLSRCE